MRDFEVVNANLCRAMRFFAGATGTGDISKLEGALALYSGIDYGVFNIAMLEDPVDGRTALVARIAEMDRHFKSYRARWSCWVCEDLLEASARRRERQTFFEAGLRMISHPPGMLAPSLAPPQRALPAIEVRRVASEADRRAFADLTSVAFDIPIGIARQVYSEERAWRGEYQGFVGYVNGRPVSMVAIVPAANALGVYSLGALPLDRRKGYGEAVLRAAAAEMRRETGMEKLVLESTDSGYALYHRMGFRDVTRYTVYLTI